MYRSTTNLYCLIITIFVCFRLVSVNGSDLLIGSGAIIITPKIGSWQQGSGAIKRGTRIHSELEANGVYITNGDTQILIISCDVGGLGYGFEVELRESIGVAIRIPPRDIIITATHAHGGPSVLKHNYIMPIDTQYLILLKGWLMDLSKKVVNSAQPARIGWGTSDVLIGYNRRFTWADGTHSMYGDASRRDFTGLEGPVDPQHTVIFATDLNNKVVSILYNNTTHQSSFYGKGVFSSGSAGEVRKSLRKEFDDNSLPVLFLNGAQGDVGGITNRLDLDRRRETDEEKIERISNLVVGETLRIFKNINLKRNPEFRHTYKDLRVGIRLPRIEDLISAKKVLSRIDEGENIRGMDMIMAYGTIRLQEDYGAHPFEILPIHAIRLGELGIVTQPCELFCQFGLDIKLRSPAAETMIVGLADGYHGYCPTIYGVLGGGYTGTPILWTKLEQNAGYEIVETASILLNKLWRSEK